MQERIQKIIAAAGIMSRRAAEELIREGRVRVNGTVVTEMGVKADPAHDHIKVDGKLINPRQPMTYILLNKPVGYVTTMDDPEGRPKVTDLLKGVKVRVYPVGRLDYNTEGLLLLTNDGEFAHQVMHPRHELPKTYLAKVKGTLTDRDVEALEQGVFLRDGKTAPAQVRRLRKEAANSWVEITIHEGRKRQVRRMFDHTGHSVIRLKRSRVGTLEIGDLPLGTYRHLAGDEVGALRDMARGAAGAGEIRTAAGVPSLTAPKEPKVRRKEPDARAMRVQDRPVQRKRAGVGNNRSSSGQGRPGERRTQRYGKRTDHPQRRDTSGAWGAERLQPGGIKRSSRKGAPGTRGAVKPRFGGEGPSGRKGEQRKGWGAGSDRSLRHREGASGMDRERFGTRARAGEGGKGTFRPDRQRGGQEGAPYRRGSGSRRDATAIKDRTGGRFRTGPAERFGTTSERDKKGQRAGDVRERGSSRFPRGPQDRKQGYSKRPAGTEARAPKGPGSTKGPRRRAGASRIRGYKF